MTYEINQIPTRKHDQNLSSNDQAAAETFANIQIGLIRVSSNQICKENKPGMTRTIQLAFLKTAGYLPHSTISLAKRLLALILGP